MASSSTQTSGTLPTSAAPSRQSGNRPPQSLGEARKRILSGFGPIPDILKWLHPMRTSRYLLSEVLNPWMRGAAMLAGAISPRRKPLSPDQSLVQRERDVIGAITQALEDARRARDKTGEQIFGWLYGFAGSSHA
ncbi:MULTISPECIES: DUF3141 domain-containing protein [Novosphingobium]|jgi:hypothetical protein|uniref:DUF3141 domain-containing protein n=2 Tax=Novosphingobium TaxID=165696 RepID=A0ABT2IAZ1_9SPHN|nr:MULTISPECIES: DUF3141 domain-containing protein [Novosphingobium]MCT2401999.1 DUF3141 domain-containing protein [Novosphingobium mangrovi (ex Huang et al. 2023)]